MKYLLVIGLNCEVYLKEPIARIFVGEQLIDEFNIQHYKDNMPDIIKKFYQDKNLLQPFSNIELNELIIKHFPPLRFYEINIDNIPNKLSIRIEIKDSVSNYTNGFMSNGTLIKLKVCYFFPLNRILLLKLYQIKSKRQFTQNYAWYRNSICDFFSLIGNSRGIRWNGENGQIFYLTDKKGFLNYNIGGNGNFTCNLVKKYGILITGVAKSYRYSFPIYFINYFLNKYIVYHEDKRNIN